MRRNFHSLSGVRFDPNFWNRKLPLSLWLLLLVSFLVSFLFTLPAPTLAHNLDQDPALSAIVNMIITHADQDEVVEEAWNWARERARMEELRQALISEATKRNPVFKTFIAVAIGTVSKYFNLISVTISSSVSKVILKMSPCSVWTKKKNIDLVLCVAEQTKNMPRSGSSKSLRRLGIGHRMSG